MPTSRRTFLTRVGQGSLGLVVLPRVSFAARPSRALAADAEWVASTASAPWQQRSRLPVSTEPGPINAIVQLDQPRQVIDGFGACFNELGWTALRALGDEDRDGVFRELFAPGVGANFTVCRMPLGSNDFSRDWYSYDEVPGDFALDHFTIENDHETLIPYIRSALQHQPDLRLWASPWSPPTWMKTNGHYAAAMPWPGSNVENGLRPDQVGREGTDMFIQDERYFRTYASYFGRFIDAYREQGIPIGMVMPQNEFNSAQVFPSCTWTPEGLARFIGYLGPEMAARDVAVFFGTMERPNEHLVDVSLQDPAVAPFIEGVGFQWAGKGSVPGIHRRYPDLKLYQTEQEYGDGRNDWRYCRYAWTMMKHYLTNGTNVYLYWNMALRKGGVSRWGWAQNSLVTVDPDAKTFSYNAEYYLLKHLSHYVRPGARRLATTSWTGHENLLAFANPDGSIVVVLQNDLCEPLPVRVSVGDRVVAPTLPPDSFSTVVLRPD
ncbi:MAG: glycoside hydrolase family 30 protein [Bacteroidota bacterium]